jgi:hypothetical protein
MSRHWPRRGARRAGRQQPGEREQPGRGTPAGRHEQRRQLRRRGVANRQPRHRRGDGEDRDAEQPERQAAPLVARRLGRVGCVRRGATGGRFDMGGMRGEEDR